MNNTQLTHQKNRIIHAINELNEIVADKHGLKNRENIRKYEPYTFTDAKTELKLMIAEIELQINNNRGKP